jgi:HD superfamily phosphohydrolase
MLIFDRAYGQINITEPIILELLASSFLRRLAGVDQGGHTKPYWRTDQIINRLEHSIGVYWLLKKYDAPLAEQVSGLIHDVSRSAFSHSIDYILEGGDGKEQNHQDNIFTEFVRNSDLPAILKKYDLDPDYILDDKNFPLKEKPLPDLCADRIDYSLRTAIAYEDISTDNLQEILNNLIVKDNFWIFKNLATAKKYAELFRLLNTNYYTAPHAGAMHQAVGEYLRHALERGYLEKADLYTTDREVLDKLAVFHDNDPELARLFTRINNKIKFKDSRKNYDKIIHLKSRLVDPLFLDKNKISRLSKVAPEWKEILKNELGHKTIYLKFID